MGIVQVMPYPASPSSGGGEAPTFFAAGASQSGSAGGLGQWPAAYQTDDVAILLVKTANQAPPDTPSGCEPVYNPVGIGAAGAAGSVALYAYWIRATSSNMAQLSIGDPGNGLTVQMLILRGCVPVGSPIEAPANDTAATSTSVTIPGLSTLGSDRLVVTACGIGAPDQVSTTNASGWANADLSGFVEITDVASIGGAGGGFVVAAGVKTEAGLVGPTAVTLETAAQQERLSFALIPA